MTTTAYRSPKSFSTRSAASAAAPAWAPAPSAAPTGAAPMIHLDEMDRFESAQTVPTVCMHCEDPICAQVCPSDAIKRSEELGVVHAAQNAARCIGCQNCELSCPFGVPMSSRA